MKILVEKGAKLDIQDNAGRTALHLASSYGKIEVVQYLVNAGADATIKDKDGKTAKDQACEWSNKQHKEEIQRILNEVNQHSFAFFFL